MIGVSKGRGFAGVVKRHHFRGCDATARIDVPSGSRFHRRVELSVARFPGMRMGGQMGTDARDGAQPRNRRSGRRGQRDPGEGRGARAQRRLRHSCGGPRGSHAERRHYRSQQQSRRLGGAVRRGVRRSGERGSAVRSGAASSGGHAARNGFDQDAARSGRVGQEVVEAEGHRARSYGFDPQSSVAAWRHDSWSATARLFAIICRARCSWAR